jgi:hypothetical protein
MLTEKDEHRAAALAGHEERYRPSSTAPVNPFTVVPSTLMSKVDQDAALAKSEARVSARATSPSDTPFELGTR